MRYILVEHLFKFIVIANLAIAHSNAESIILDIAEYSYQLLTVRVRVK
ncbi:hypothetical protein NIES4101_73920 [Calothrix sp. NIES-4101]|nr:hypothetical protein NIES4101_73920 [Calothrix sp. NIES-4101]